MIALTSCFTRSVKMNSDRAGAPNQKTPAILATAAAAEGAPDFQAVEHSLSRASAWLRAASD